MQEYVNKYGKTLLYIVGGIALLYALIWIFTFKPQIPLEYKHALDSLNRANADLIAKQKQIDSTISVYKGHIDSLDLAINGLDTKKTEIHNHYGEMGKKASEYTPTQVDSFFKARYNY
jgi:hypothetical protein